MEAAADTGRPEKSLTPCPQARHYKFKFYGITTSLEGLRRSVRTTGDVGLWLLYFPWCMFYLIGPYCSDIHPFPNIARATTVHELGVALLESIYSCLLLRYREVGRELEGTKCEWPDWFEPPEVPVGTEGEMQRPAWWSRMTTLQREAVLLMSSPPVVLYPLPRVHGVSHAANTHHDCCLRFRPVGHCRGLCYKHKPYPALRLQGAKRAMQADSIVLPGHAAVAHLAHGSHAGLWAKASSDYERWVHKTMAGQELQEALAIIRVSRANKAQPPRGVVVVHRDERLQHREGDDAIPGLGWEPSRLPWVNSVKTTRCISKQCVSIHHVVYATQSANATTGSSKRQRLDRALRYVHYRTA